MVGLVLTWRQRSERWLLVPDAAIGPIGFLLGDFASAFGPTTVRIHHLPGGTTLTNYNEPFFQPVRDAIAVLGATLLVALFHAVHAKWRKRAHVQNQTGVAL